jgi:hypothetical protein
VITIFYHSRVGKTTTEVAFELPPLNSRPRAEDIDISNNLPRNHKVIGRYASEILLLGPRRTSHALDGLFGPPFFQCRQAFRVEPCAGVFRHHAKDHLGR